MLPASRDEHDDEIASDSHDMAVDASPTGSPREQSPPVEYSFNATARSSAAPQSQRPVSAAAATAAASADRPVSERQPTSDDVENEEEQAMVQDGGAAMVQDGGAGVWCQRGREFADEAERAGMTDKSLLGACVCADDSTCSGLCMHA